MQHIADLMAAAGRSSIAFRICSDPANLPASKHTNEFRMKTRKRVAFLTTWQEICGIAHYSAFLKRALDPYLDITVFPTTRDLIQKAKSRTENQAADAYIDQIADQVGDYDTVIMQFEPGIYGNDPATSLDRVQRILRRSRNFIIAFHYVPREIHQTWVQVFRSKKPQVIVRNLLNSAIAIMRERVWKNFFNALSEHARTHKVTVVAHNKSDARFLSFHLPGIEILDHPLCYMDDAFITNIDHLAEASQLSKFLPKPRPDTRYLGVFGFYSEYKGFETAIRALKYLPENYELLMFSSIHHAALRPNQGINDYLQTIMSLVETEKLLDRVHFIGSVSDNDMLLGMAVCDAVVVPYTNAGHAASGVSSQSVELSRPTYLSRNNLFTEFEKYFNNDNFEFFDIGNSIELAQKIRRNEGLGKNRDVNGLRLVDFPVRSRPVTIRDTASDYMNACGAPFDVRDSLPKAAE